MTGVLLAELLFYGIKALKLRTDYVFIFGFVLLWNLVGNIINPLKLMRKKSYFANDFINPYITDRKYMLIFKSKKGVAKMKNNRYHSVGGIVDC